ncbi:MAG: phosphatidylserine/phosphatidylglycerophosphate/cardiolipin synthase family protein, partial [Planctomycetota bacterium]|nr:phosphatidylserine/phosphatidylglycerophosphate/cardiolipin synthase family protein [Planctomycetota bacterium]
IWSTIGSANLDSRALFLNYVINAAVTDSGLAAAMENQFQSDLRHCQEISYEEWRQRSLGDRAREIMLAPIEGQM